MTLPDDLAPLPEDPTASATPLPNLPTPPDPETGVKPDPGNSDMDHLIEPIAADDDVYDRLVAVSLDEDDGPDVLADTDPANPDG